MSNTKLPKRSEVAQKDKWKLSDIYPNNQLWEDDFTKVKEMSKNLEKFKGTLSKSAENLLACLDASTMMDRLYEKINVYAHMSSHQDTTDSFYQGLADRVDSLGVEASSSSSYITPEILSIPDQTLDGFLSSSEKLQHYKRMLNEIRRRKPHILSAKEEQLLSMSLELANGPSTIYEMINNADIKFPIIKDAEGNDIEITKGRFITLLESSDRRVRKDAFDALYSSYKSQKNTFAATFSSNVKANLFFAKTRNYPSSLESYLFQDNVSTDVYNNLISAIHNNMHLMHKYMRLRKKLLGLDELHMYDLYTPIVGDVSMDIEWPEAIDTVQKGLAALGTQYESDLNKGLTSGWIDVYENEGKRSGAYSWGCYDSHPYVLMNYTSSLDNMFTLAHEMGHALHSFYSDANQPYIYAQYKIFVAEVASTCNEALLMDYLLKKTTDKKQKLYLLNHYMEAFRTTVYRQTMFAEFEKITHEKAEAGEALTADLLCSIYRDLNIRYYGPDMVVDEYIDYEWSRIPHFYTSFYVYKYATGFSAATALSKAILTEGQPALDLYLNFLKSGGSDYPLELLKNAGVDMTTPNPVNDALKVFETILNEFEALIEQ